MITRLVSATVTSVPKGRKRGGVRASGCKIWIGACLVDVWGRGKYLNLESWTAKSSQYMRESRAWESTALEVCLMMRLMRSDI